MSPAAAAKKKETFVVVDGTHLAYRSHFAFINRPLTTKDGEVTSAVYGFIMALRRILQDLRPDRAAVAFDPSGPTFRHEVYEAYKAQRERMPEDLRAQLPRILEYLEASGIPVVVVDGFEADDVMATLALRAAERGMVARIVSNDKDLLQVVQGDVAVVNLGRASEPPKLMTPDAVLESFGVTPEQIVDFLSLTGDSSDNVPGVPGVGKKTAAKLLSEHGTLDALLGAASSLRGKLKENLLESGNVARESRELIRLRTDVDVPTDPDRLTLGEPDREALFALFEKLELNSLKDELGEVTRAPGAEGYERVDDEAGLKRLAAELAEAKPLAVAILAAASGARGAEVVGLAFCGDEGHGRFVSLGHASGNNVSGDELVRSLGPVLESSRVPKVAHDAKQVIAALRKYGIELGPVSFDTMLASYVIDASRRNHGLDVLARERLHLETTPEKDVVGSGRSKIPLAQAPLEDLTKLGAERADVVLRLAQELVPEVAAAGLQAVYEEIEMPLLHVLADMETAGVRLDREFLAKLSVSMAEELERIEKEAWEAAEGEFNLASPKQVAEVLFGRLGLKPRRRTKTGHSTDADVLSELSAEHEAPALILRHREISKLRSTYVDALPALIDPGTGRLHTSFNQAVAATGRLSSSEPNLQNVPVRTTEGKQIRQAFIPSQDDWRILSCDYSQIELRILAHMAQDEPLLDAFREDRDVHRTTAALVFDVPEDEVTAGQRAQAKTINFAVIYGQGAVNLGRSLGTTTREASRFIEAYFDRYPGVREFIDTTHERAARDLWVETLAGRRRSVREIASPDHRTRSFGERIAVNTPIQGSAADVMKLAMIAVHGEMRARGLAARMILTVHDELVFDCPAGELEELRELVVSCMEGAMELSVPLKVDTGSGRNWSEAH